MTLIAMFPGQSSRYPEMLERFDLREASELLGRDLCQLDLAKNRNVQVGVFLANHFHYQALGIDFAHSVGLSLGEYNHLVHIGALAFADALRLVDARGELYDTAEGGLMVSIFPLPATTTEAAIAKLGLGDRCGIGLYNSPRQHVLSGERAAVEAVLAELDKEDYFEGTVIESRIPMHAPCFAPTAARFGELVSKVPFHKPLKPYLPNVLGNYTTDDDPRPYLVAHVFRPVRWQASIDAIARRVPDPFFVEVGPKGVLHNLFTKDWMPGRRAKTDRADLAVLAKELRDAA
jgi:[acyl-carrier-protein] S-malonyltransferase